MGVRRSISAVPASSHPRDAIRGQIVALIDRSQTVLGQITAACPAFIASSD